MSSLRGSTGPAVIVQLQRLFQNGTLTGSTEGELLERFVARRDEAAFEVIVARYGPMVLHVCRQLLHDPDDVEDAFQATFLVLVRKANSLKRCDLLGNWLYGVAQRVALRARSLEARRRARAAAAIASARSRADQDSALEGGADRFSPEQIEPELWLHQEIARLPEKYRVPIVLCYMEGLTHDDAAHRLNWPLGTVKGRLARARDLLRRRLTHRGFTMTESTFATSLCAPLANVAVPAALIQTTLQAATSISSRAGLSLAATSSISLPVATLGEGVLEAMTMTQVKAIALPLLLLGVVTTGVVALAAQGNPNEKKGDSRAQPAQALDERKAASQPTPAAQSGSKTTEELLRDQLGADEELYASLVVPGRSLSADDFRSLARWSHRLLNASRTLSSDPPARIAAYALHRNRMKSLNTLAAKASSSNEIKAMTQAQLREAEQLLASVAQESRRSLPSTSAVAAGPAGLPGDSRNAVERNAATGTAPNDSSQAQTSPDAPAGATRMGRADQSRMPTGGMARGGRAMGAARSSLTRSNIAAFAVEMALRNPDPRSEVIRKKLDEPISMSFANPTPLEDLLKYLKQATTTPTYAGIPMYVDPKGLEETNTTITSTIAIDLEGIPLKTTLRLALKQLGLAYCVRDGVLIISSVQGINDELAEERSEHEAANPPNRGLQ